MSACPTTDVAGTEITLKRPFADLCEQANSSSSDHEGDAIEKGEKCVAGEGRDAVPTAEDGNMELDVMLDHLSSTSADLKSCGTAVTHLLQRVFTLLRTPTPNCPLAGTTATDLVRLADEKIMSYPYKEVPTCWRCLYTDASLTKVIALLKSDGQDGDADWLEAVKDLDMALIVAGAPGESRSDHIFDLIRLVQARVPLCSSSPLNLRSTPNSAKRIKLSSPSSPPPIDHPIPRITSPPSLETFLTLIKSPFILSGGCSTWPALLESPWSSFSHLRSIAGPGRVVPVEVGGNYTTANWGQKIIPFDEFLSTLEKGEGEKLYLAQHDLFRQFPKLVDDVVVPDYVYSSPDSELESYVPPSNEDGFVMNAWLGPEGTVSPPHTDPYFNCYAQVVGSKWIWVAPPSVSTAMSTFGASSIHEPEEQDVDEEEDGSSSHYMTNTSRVDVTKPVSATRFPTFVKEVVPVAQQAVLKEGDMLFMPPGWWHSMKSLEVSFSVSIWF